MILTVPEVRQRELRGRLDFKKDLAVETGISKSLTQWRMEADDGPLFRYIYNNFRPQRHLEFGTWEGAGALYCIEECDATVWTINLRQGEVRDDGSWAYGTRLQSAETAPAWANKLTFQDQSGPVHWIQTDSLGLIGHKIHERDLGHRVCQIFCDSTKWDISNYPQGFFDTVLIDGGHLENIVENDTRKALSLVRSGGIVMWHDFCPHSEVLSQCASTRGVMSAITKNWDFIKNQCKDVFWINPSWILVGVKK